MWVNRHAGTSRQEGSMAAAGLAGCVPCRCSGGSCSGRTSLPAPCASWTTLCWASGTPPTPSKQLCSSWAAAPHSSDCSREQSGRRTKGVRGDRVILEKQLRKNVTPTSLKKSLPYCVHPKAQELGFCSFLSSQPHQGCFAAVGETSCVSQSITMWAKATGDIKQRWQPALLVPGLSQKIVPVCLKEL